MNLKSHETESATPSESGLDARMVPILLWAGWLLITLGAWGAFGRPWWLWALSVGSGLMVTGGIYSWAFLRIGIAESAPASEHPKPYRVATGGKPA